MRILKIIKILFGRKGKERPSLCVNCKHFAQGNKYSFCANGKQTNSEFTKYTYPSLNCNLFESGTHKTRIEYMKTKSK